MRPTIRDPGRTRLAVLGSPIEHSRSPALHAAAYRELELPWRYERHEVAEGGLAAFLAGLDDGWRGLSITMPLKPEALRCSAGVSDIAAETGAVNTLRLGGADGPRGYNTDVHGIAQALREAGVDRVGHALVLGAGATARSVISAVRRLGAEAVTVAARRPQAAAAGASFAGGLGLAAAARTTREMLDADADLVVNTIPGGAAAGLEFAPGLERVPLLEIAYDPWPSPLAARWHGSVVSGLEMLLHQAVAQVRLFVLDDPHVPLPDEPAVLAAMRAAL